VTRWWYARRAALLLLPCAVIGAAEKGVAVVDDSGMTLRLATPAMRIVSLAPAATELLFAAGAGTRVVGVDAASDYPPAARNLPRVGNSATIDVERVAALRPDLVVAWPHGAARRQAEQIRRLGIPVFTLDPGSIDSIAHTIESLGSIAGTSEVARARAREVRNRGATLARTHADAAVVTAFVQIWDAPLMSINDRHLIAAGLRMCGGRNIFAAASSLTPTPDREAVIAANPEVIILLAGPAEAARWTVAWKRWPGVRAVGAGAVVGISPDLLARQTPRFLDGVEQLCGHLEHARRGR
jgi:iron complex transport system substrate-binding protein